MVVTRSLCDNELYTALSVYCSQLGIYQDSVMCVVELSYHLTPASELGKTSAADLAKSKLAPDVPVCTIWSAYVNFAFDS